MIETPSQPIEKQHTDTNGYPYTTIENDPNKVRTYTLKNGLKVFLAQNFDAPKIQTYIPVKTGSNNDPVDNTGLAHYLEHMMFKGTSKIGSADWEKEKALLDQISDLYEAHKLERNAEAKKEIYKKIDQISQEASQFAIANEYDKLISSLGATGTNAHTWLDETVYKNNIPSNELEKWLKIESERFSEIQLRLFHTELESVYEEFNRAQDQDARLVNYALMEGLFPTHPNGQQTTLGKAEHLRNPSMKAIHQYFNDFYVPNNYALVLVGDLDFENTIKKIDDYFGRFSFRALPEKKAIAEKPLTKITRKIVKSPSIPRVQLAWRTNSYGTRESMLAEICANILSNRGEAGLIDLNINQAQRALGAQAYNVGLKNYGYISVIIVPKEEQTLQDGIDLILEQIQLLKDGFFPDWLIPAIVNDFKIQRLKAWETADGLATTLYDDFIKDRNWSDELQEIEIYKSITKEEIIDFAKEFFIDNYVVVEKQKGINENLIRVENPGITPVKINREAQSDYLKEMMSIESPAILPEFIDYDKEIITQKIGDKHLSFVKNKDNDLAQIFYVFPFGTDHDQQLSLALYVMQYLGTNDYTPEEMKEEFFKIGVSNDFKILSDRFQISLFGLEENLPKGVELLNHWIQNLQPNQEVYDQYVETILESRNAAKKDKSKIMSALVNYAKFGAFSRKTDVLSANELRKIQCKELTSKIKNLFDFPYQLFFYGQHLERFSSHISTFIKPTAQPIPPAKKYPENATGGQVFFIPYDMVQVEMSKVAKGNAVNPDNFGRINVFNEYFGRGLSSIVFQEIRESKSLAYSAYVSYQTGSELGRADYVLDYIGTQPDKLATAVKTMAELMLKLPEASLQFDNSKNSALKQLASRRITRTNIFFSRLNLEKLGIKDDYRKKMYAEIQQLNFSGLDDFYNENVKKLQFNTAIIGKKENLDQQTLSTLGAFKELTLEEIFGY